MLSYSQSRLEVVTKFRRRRLFKGVREYAISVFVPFSVLTTVCDRLTARYFLQCFLLTMSIIKDNGETTSNGESTPNGVNSQENRVSFSIDEDGEERDEVSENSLSMPTAMDSKKFKRQRKPLR